LAIALFWQRLLIPTISHTVLLARQFVDLTRVRIEGLLSAFPKLLTADSQHTFIETANVRYLYQPVDNLYVVVITTKSSNILEDLQTLHLLAKLVTLPVSFARHLLAPYVASSNACRFCRFALLAN
jgi:hypothetical protein